jgi:hypothetical protein
MQIVLPKTETAYLFLLKPQPAMEKGKPDQFSVTFLWDEGDQRLAKLEQAIEDVAVAKFGATAKAKLKNGQLKNPLRPGSDKEGKKDEEAFAGKLFMTCRSTERPQVVDANMEDIINSMDVYSGCVGRADIWLYAYDKAGNKGVSCTINSFQKLDDGERKSGRRSASDAFSDLDDEDADLL